MPPVGVVGGTGAFGGNHGGPERSLGCALRAEGRTIPRPLEPFEDLPADAQRRLASDDGANIEQPLGIVGAVLVTQPVAALRNRADAAPLPVANLEHLVQQSARCHVALRTDGACVLGLD